VIIVLAAWMLDRAACADMVIGAPRAEVAAPGQFDCLEPQR
jgi:hypothetical protein